MILDCLKKSLFGFVLLCCLSQPCSADSGLKHVSRLKNGCQLYLDENLKTENVYWNGRDLDNGTLPTELRVATANIIGFGRLGAEYKKWKQLSNDDEFTDRERSELRTLRKNHQKALAAMINDHDIVAIQEAESVEEALRFNSEYLGGAFRVVSLNVFAEVSSQNNIFLIRKGLNLSFKVTSFSNFLVKSSQFGNSPKALFPHDFPVLMVYPFGKKGRPLAVLGNTHVKLQRTNNSRKEDASVFRAAQLETMTAILQGIRQRFKEFPFPLYLVGDVNQNMDRPIFEMPPHYAAMMSGKFAFQDAFSIHRITSKNDRITSTRIDYETGFYESNQRDAILISAPEGVDPRILVTDPRVYHYEISGRRIQVPTTLDQLIANTFDHLPVSAKIQLEIVDQMQKDRP